MINGPMAMIPASLRPTEIWIGSLLRRQRRYGTLHGPFRGTRMEVDGRPNIVSGLLGIYECELHPVIEHIVRNEPASIINLGAHEGYYAIGLARRLPSAFIVAYEATPAQHAVIQRNAELNGIGNRLVLRGLASAADLRADLQRVPAPAVVICDIEGAEMQVMDPVVCPELTHTELLIEVHGHNISRTLTERFQSSHRLTTIPARTPNFTADVPRVPWYMRGTDATYLLVERKQDEGWIWAVPRTRSAISS